MPTENNRCSRGFSPEPGNVRYCLEPVGPDGLHEGAHWAYFRRARISWPNVRPLA